MFMKNAGYYSWMWVFLVTLTTVFMLLCIITVYMISLFLSVLCFSFSHVLNTKITSFPCDWSKPLHKTKKKLRQTVSCVSVFQSVCFMFTLPASGIKGTLVQGFSILPSSFLSVNCFFHSTIISVLSTSSSSLSSPAWYPRTQNGKVNYLKCM